MLNMAKKSNGQNNIKKKQDKKKQDKKVGVKGCVSNARKKKRAKKMWLKSEKRLKREGKRKCREKRGLRKRWIDKRKKRKEKIKRIW